MAARFFQERGKKHLFPEALEIVKFYKDQKIPIALITAQNDIIASQFSEYLGMEDLAANGFREEAGGFGEEITPHCFQEGKIEWARIIAEKRGLSLGDCAFYSDSINDVPLLAAVGSPVVVNPDPLLEQKAADRGWPVAFFGKKK